MKSLLVTSSESDSLCKFVYELEKVVVVFALVICQRAIKYKHHCLQYTACLFVLRIDLMRLIRSTLNETDKKEREFGAFQFKSYSASSHYHFQVLLLICTDKVNLFYECVLKCNV